MITRLEEQLHNALKALWVNGPNVRGGVTEQVIKALDAYESVDKYDNPLKRNDQP